MSAQTVLFTEVLNNPEFKRKCFGIAKNYFTNALKADARNVNIPTYPYIFSKPLSSYSLLMTKSYS